MVKKFFRVEPLWKGQDAFVLCGGPSVTYEAVEALRGRNVIAVNRMYLYAPWVPILFFGDHSFWRHEHKSHPKQVKAFRGQIMSISKRSSDFDPRVKHLRRVKPPIGIAPEPDTVSMLNTSSQGAINVAYHLRPRRLLLIGLDNGTAANGRWHCHSEYPWTLSPRGWRLKREQLALTVEPLRAAGIEVINCSPVSTLPWWPKRSLFEVIR